MMRRLGAAFSASQNECADVIRRELRSMTREEVPETKIEDL